MLGPLLVSGERISPRERAALAALVVRRGQFLDAGQLAQAIWGDDPPQTWHKQVQISVGRLRKHLGADRIETAGSSYALRVADDELDLAVFEGLLGRARHLAAVGEPDRATSSFRGALALWRGAPFGDLAAWPPGVDEAARLGEVSRTAEEQLLQARLDAGLHRSVVADAEALVRQDPRRERRWAMLATALYRSGRQQESLSVLREARRQIVAEGLDPGQELSDLESAVLRHDVSLQPAPEPRPARDECPYRGLAAFDSGDAEVYFGRELEAGQALERVLANRLIVLAGPSGCGKSSLARAGVLPVMVARGLSTGVTTPGSGGLGALRVALAAAPRGVVLVDQFEELFLAGSPEDWGEYATALSGFMAADGMVVLTVRSDFLDQCAALPGISDRLSQCLQFVTGMGEAGLRQAVEEPARLAGLRVEPGLTEVILRDVHGEAASLPHMSHALAETWARREGHVLTVEGYEAAGGISGAIVQSAEGLYQQLDASQRLLCRRVLTRLVDLLPDGVPLRRRARLAPLSEDSLHLLLLARLSSARLISIEADDVLIAHESLAVAWPRLRGWLDEDASGARTMRALASEAEEWASAGLSSSYLLRGARLQTTLEWRDRTNADLTPIEHRFLEASAALEHRELDALRQQARTERQRSRRLRGLLAATGVLLCLSLVAGLVAVSAQRRTAERGRLAQAARADAEFTSLVSTSLALRGSQRDVAALLAAEAYRRRPDDPRARSALMATLVSAGGFLGTTYLPQAEWVTGRATGASTSLLVDNRGRVGLYDSATLEVRRLFSLTGAPRLDPRFRPLVATTPDGRDAAVAFRATDPTSTWVATVDLATGVTSSATVPLVVDAMALAPDGASVALVDNDGTVSAMAVQSGTLRRLAGDAHGIGYTPRGQLVTTVADGRVLLDDHMVARVPADAVGGPIAVTGATVITSGARLVAAVSLPKRDIVWSQAFSVKQTNVCQFVAASEQARSVFCGDSFGRIQRRDLATGQVTANLDRQLGAVGELTVSNDGQLLTAVGGAIPAVSRWRLDGGGAVTRLVARDHVAIGYRGTTDQALVAARPADILTWDDFTQFQVWNMRTDKSVAPTIHGDSFGWVGPDTVQGVFKDTGAIGYLNVATNQRYPGTNPLRPDAQLAVPDQSGKHVYITYPGGRIDNLDPKTGASAGSTMLVDGYPLSASPSRDDSKLAVAVARPDGPQLVVLDTATGTAVARRKASVEAVAFAPNGDVYGASETGRVTRFSMPELIESAALPGARGWVNSLQFSRDGSLLMVTANDSTVSLYDTRTTTRLGDPITSEAPGIIPGFLKPDGRELLVNVTAGVAAWSLDPDAQFAAVCRIAGRQLGNAEWRTYLADLGPYRATCPSPR